MACEVEQSWIKLGIPVQRVVEINLGKARCFKTSTGTSCVTWEFSLS
jgi:hypothetical protein